jgi:hypothetical protein
MTAGAAIAARAVAAPERSPRSQREVRKRKSFCGISRNALVTAPRLSFRDLHGAQSVRSSVRPTRGCSDGPRTAGSIRRLRSGPRRRGPSPQLGQVNESNKVGADHSCRDAAIFATRHAHANEFRSGRHRGRSVSVRVRGLAPEDLGSFITVQVGRPDYRRIPFSRVVGVGDAVTFVPSRPSRPTRTTANR